jgi:hypothetical protein
MSKVIHVSVTLIAAMAGVAHAQEIRHFKTWLAACDNLRTCSAYGFSDDAADNPGYIRITRAAGPNAPPRVTLQGVDLNGDAKARVTWRVLVDGAAPAGLAAVATRPSEAGPRAELSPDQARGLIAALRNGAVLTLAGAKSPTAIPLTGAAASLLWIDDRQGRAGTITALAARGPKPAAAVPAPPLPPAIRAAPVAAQAGLPAKLPAVLAANPALSECDTGEERPEPVVVRLGGGQVLWGAACSVGAYNVVYTALIADEAGRHARVVHLPLAIATPSNDDTQAMNLEYDARTGVLSSFGKGRGFGDCGEQTSWVWDGRAFRVLDDRVMPDCHGVSAADWPSVFHGVVSR